MARRTRQRAGARGGFSILELAIVLAILAAIGALVFPALWRWVGDYRFREATGQFASAMDAWRAAAQRDGVAVMIAAERGPDGLRVRARALRGSAPAAGAEKSAGEPAAPEGLVAFVFPRGFTSGAPDEEREPKGPDAARDGARGGDVELALLLPDGTAAGGAAWTVRDSAGRAAELRVDRWGGLLRLVGRAEGAGPGRSPR